MGEPLGRIGDIVLLSLSILTGAMAFIVAFFLYLQRREPMFRSFSAFSASLMGFGLVDSLLSVFRAGTYAAAGDRYFVAIGCSYLIIIGSLIFSLIAFTRDLLKLGSRTFWLAASALPALVALGLSVFLFARPDAFGLDGLFAIGRLFLLFLFASALGAGFVLVRHWPRLRDRLFRRIIGGTGILLLAFLPVWIMNWLGILRIKGFLWFLLSWNIGALIIAGRAYFQNRNSPLAEGLFSPVQMTSYAQRFGLTAREAEIAALHAQGFSSKEIAVKLFIAPKTVRNHISNIYAKSRINQRRELLETVRLS
jgi:DNA-binding CsgD family transcriptional regulator